MEKKNILEFLGLLGETITYLNLARVNAIGLRR